MKVGIVAITMLMAGALAPAGDVESLPLVVGRAIGNGAVLVYDDAAQTGVPGEQFVAFPSTFNAGVELSHADVDGDGTRDFVAFHAPYGAWPELRAYSGATAALIACDIVDANTVTDHLTARYARLIGNAKAVPVVGRGGAAPSLRVKGRPAISLPASYAPGVHFAVARLRPPGGDVAVTVSRGEARTFRVYNLADGQMTGEFPLLDGAAAPGPDIDVADVLESNNGVEVIVGIPGSSPQVRIFALDGTLLQSVALGESTPFVLRTVAVPTGQGPGGRSRILAFPDGGVQSPIQVFEVNPTAGTFTTADTGFAFGSSGLRATLGPIGGDDETTLILAPPSGFEPFLLLTNLDYANSGPGLLAFDTNYTGGVAVAVGNTNGHGAPEIVTGAGAGAPPLVRIFTSTQPVRLVSQFFAYDTAFRGGVRVATGDLNGDGVAEIITGTAGGSAPLVRIFNQNGDLLNEFFAYDPAITIGVNVAVGDVAEDSAPEIIAAPTGPGVAVQLAIFRTDGTLITTFQAASAAFDAAVSVAVGDVDGDGKDDIIAGARNSGTTTGVRVFRGGEPGSGDMLANFAPFGPGETLGVNVAFVGNALGAAGMTPRILVGEGGPTTRVGVFDLNGIGVQTISTFAGGSTQGVNVATIRVPAPAPPRHYWVMY